MVERAWSDKECFVFSASPETPIAGSAAASSKPFDDQHRHRSDGQRGEEVRHADLADSQRRAMAMMSSPPVAVTAAMAGLRDGSPMVPATVPARSDSPPWYTRIVSTETPTPHPSAEEKARAAKPSSMALMASSE